MKKAGRSADTTSGFFFTKLIPWRSQPALSGLELGSYNTAADGSQTVDVQRRFAGYSVAVFDASDALWQALNS